MPFSNTWLNYRYHRLQRDFNRQYRFKKYRSSDILLVLATLKGPNKLLLNESKFHEDLEKLGCCCRSNSDNTASKAIQIPKL
jgi:hypothetical protein